MTLKDKLKFWLALNNYIEMIVHDTSLLSLPNAMEDSLDYLKAFGGTEITPKVYFDSVTANGGCEQRNLPAEYTQLEYIESTGTQYIDTGLKLNQNSSVEVDWMYYTESTISTSGRMFGARYTSAPRNSFSIGSNTGRASIETEIFAQLGDNSTRALNTIVIGQWDTYKLSADGFYISGVKQGDLPVTAFETPFTVKLFAFEQASSSSAASSIGCGVGRCKQFKVWNDNILVMDLIPAKNSNNVIGMYDIVSGTFFMNVGTDTFTAGPNVVPTPDTPIDIYCNNGALKVKHQSGLPLGYTLLDSIIFDSTQIIDTGFIPDNNSRIESKCYRTGTDCWFYGASPTNPRVTLYHSGTGTSCWGNQSRSNFGFAANAEYTFIEDKNGLTINSTLYPWNSGTADDFICDRSLTIGNCNGATGTKYFAGNLYYMRIYDNDVLVRNFVPCKNPSNVVGMYDTVSQTFFTNIDAGDFIAGNVVNDPLETYIDNLVPAGKNLFDSSVFNTYVGDTISYIYHQIPNGTYTMSTNFPPQANTQYTNVWIMAGIQTSGQSSETNGVSLGYPKTITVTDGWYTVAYRSTNSNIPCNPKDYNWQLEKGSTATDYEPYSTKHKVETIQITGKNLFDAQWQAGIYSPTNGAFTPTTNRICNTNIIQVKPSTNYTISCPDYALASGMRWLFYDANKNFISANTTGAITITTPSNAKYINFYIANNLTVVTAPDVQIEQGSTATEYEPYFDGGSAVAENLFSLGTYQDSQEILSGAITRNIGIKVLDGTEDGWSKTNNSFSNTALFADKKTEKSTLFCSHFQYNTGTTSTIPSGCIGTASTSTNTYFRNDALSTVEDWQQWLADQYNTGTPVIVIYPLATSTTESVSSQPLTYIDNYTLTIEDASISNPTVNATNSTHTISTPDKPLDINCNNGVIKVSKNLFDVNNVIIQANTSIGADGSLIANTATKVCMTYLPVKPNTTYTISGDVLGGDSGAGTSVYFRLAEYTSSKQFITRGEGVVGSSYTVTTGANTYFARFHCITRADLNTYQLEQGSVVTPYMSYGSIYTDGIVEMMKIYGNNFIDLSTVTDGYYYDPQGNYTASSVSRLTDYMPIEAREDAKVYFKSLSSALSLNVRINIFNSNKVWQSQEVLQLAPNADGTKIVTPTDNGYIRISGNYTGGAIVDWNTASVTKSLCTATAEMLLKLSDYQDVQNIINGAVTRNVGVKVLDGTENWSYNAQYLRFVMNIPDMPAATAHTLPFISTHYQVIYDTTTDPGYIYNSGQRQIMITDAHTSVESWTQWLSDQYNAGHPVIVLYPLDESTTESVVGQSMQIAEGNNTAEITQASLDNLELEAKYNNIP